MCPEPMAALVTPLFGNVVSTLLLWRGPSRLNNRPQNRSEGDLLESQQKNLEQKRAAWVLSLLAYSRRQHARRK